MKKIYLFIVTALAVLSCDSYLDITPKGQVIPQTAEDFRKFLDKGYAKAPAGHSSFTSINPSFKSDISLRADELIFRENGTTDVSSEMLSIFSWEEVPASFGSALYPYKEFFESTFYVNEVISSGANKMPPSGEKNQILAEAYALRAYNLFNLVNMYAVPYNKATAHTDKGVPVATKVDLEQTFPKQSVATVYTQIFSDIAKAEELMTLSEQDKTQGLHYRFSRVSLYAFASRAYLYAQEYEKSVEYADKVLKINDKVMDLRQGTTPSPVDESSVESLLALDGPYTLFLRQKVFVSDVMIQKFDQANDLRFNIYIQKGRTAYGIRKNQRCSFRVSEIYLNKAEALAKLGKENEAKNTLLAFAENRYAENYFSDYQNKVNGLTNNDLTDEILEERARELIFEGHRWFDLRRTSQKEITHTYQGKTYTLQANDPRYTIPFPEQAVQENPLLNN